MTKTAETQADRDAIALLIRQLRRHIKPESPAETVAICRQMWHHQIKPHEGAKP